MLKSHVELPFVAWPVVAPSSRMSPANIVSQKRNMLSPVKYGADENLDNLEFFFQNVLVVEPLNVYTITSRRKLPGWFVMNLTYCVAFALSS